jgi:hypothetical protein
MADDLSTDPVALIVASVSGRAEQAPRKSRTRARLPPQSSVSARYLEETEVSTHVYPRSERTILLCEPSPSSACVYGV